VTAGVSMQPLLYKNDLAIVRAQSTYHVGDVVLYNSAVLGRPVLHRIILIQNGQYYFKGDNNNFVDPGYATRSELVGKLWVHVPDARRRCRAGSANHSTPRSGGSRFDVRRARRRKATPSPETAATPRRCGSSAV
jgi:signal peptidase I